MISERIFVEAMARFFSPISHLLEDPEVSEVMVNGPSAVFVERHGRLSRVDVVFDGEESLRAALRVVAQYVGRPFDEAHPILEGRLPDGSRIEAVLSPIAHRGTHLAIRKFQARAVLLSQLLENGALSEDGAAYLQAAVFQKRNVLVSGGTGSGKTSLLNLLSSFIPDDERIVVLEDARELSLLHPHVVQLEARPADEAGRGAVSVRTLLRATLRLRPDRIVVGEIRDATALDLVQAMTSGHAGCLSTLHASHPHDALLRLETMALFADVGLPLSALRQQVASAVDVIVQVERQRSGRRVVSEIAEVRGLLPDGSYSLHSVTPGGERNAIAAVDVRTQAMMDAADRVLPGTRRAESTEVVS